MMKIVTTYPSDIYFCTGLNGSREKSRTDAFQYNPGGGRKWLQPASSCNYATNSSTYTVFVPTGKKVCVSIVRNNSRSDDVCGIATRGTTISTAMAKAKGYTCEYNGNVTNNSTNCLNSYLANSASALEDYMDSHCTSASCKGCVYDSSKPIQYICKKS